jgi:V/A-type H+-transporting ATPase subunit C
VKRLSEYRLPFTYNTLYAYGVGRIRALETRLLRRHDISRLIGAEDTDAFLRILGETEYGETTTSLSDPDHFEDLLSGHLVSTLNLIVHLSKDPEVTDLLKMRSDYHNLKILLKGKISGRDMEFVLLHSGQVAPAVLLRAIRDDDVSGLPGYLAQAIRTIEELSPSDEIDPQRLDVLVDKAMFSHFLSIVMKAGMVFLWGWLEREIDLLNIKTFLRLRWSQQAPELLKAYLCEGGSLAVEFYRMLDEEPLEGLPQRFGQTRYAKLLDEGVASLQTQESFARLEQLCDGFLITYLRRAGLTTFGLEPLMAYGLIKEFEIKAIRTIFICKWNHLPPQTIQERLPDVYL